MSSDDDPAQPPDRSFAGRLIVALAAFVCLFFVTTLRDAALFPLPALLTPAPPIPTDITVRDAALTVTVVDEADRPAVGASARVFAMRDGKAYFAGEQDVDAAGQMTFHALPRGEVWVLAYGPGRSRASLRAVLVAGARDARLVLRTARALDVVVVDESEHPIAGAEIEVLTTDPLPYAARTAADGTARVDRLGPPPYRVRASARGYDDASRAGVVPGAAPLRLRLERLSTLVVTVVGEDGKPAAGATVLAAGTRLWPARSTLTDDRGTARIGGLHGGVYDLEARRGDAVSRTEVAVPVKRGDVKEIELRLEAGKRVTVTVTDGDGDAAKRVKGASVVLVADGLSSFPLHGRTDAQGLVALGPIARSKATVSARAQGFVATSAVFVEATATEARIALRRGGALAGDVVDDRGYPIAGATIEVIGADSEGLPIDETTAMTEFRQEHFERMLPGPMPLIPMGELGVMPGPIPGLPTEGASMRIGVAPVEGDPWTTRADGEFRAEPVPPGRVHAIVRHPDYVEAMSEVVTIREGGEARVHVVLRQGGWIEGRVLEADRTPVAGARIELAATEGSIERTTYAADDGTFTFKALPDEVLLSVSRPEDLSEIVARVLVQVPERDRHEVEIVLPKPRGTVTIHVADDRGYPVDRVEVRVASLDLAEPRRRTLFTSDAGDAELRDAVGLPLRITLVRPGKAPRVNQIDSAPPKLELTLDEGVRAHGVVTARDGRDRVADADVTVFTATGARHARTDEEGAYELADLAPGRVRIAVSDADHAPAETVTEVRGDRDHAADLGAIDVSEAGEVEGVVVDASDEPVAGARVAMGGVPTYLPLGRLPRGITATDRDGRFTLKNLPEGTVSLEAYVADLGRSSIDGVPVRAGRTTTRVKIAIDTGTPATPEPKGAGSVAVTLAERGTGASRIVVIAMVPYGSEAEAAGIEPGDQIVAIDGTEVHSIERARRRLTGPLNEDVLVSLRRDEVGSQTSWLLPVRRERVRR